MRSIDMKQTDLLHRFIFDNCDIRGEIISLEQSYQEVLTHNNYSPAIKHLLGEFLAAAGLLSSTLKFDGRIILQARGDGIISTIMAECTHHNQLRAIVRLNPDITPDDSFAELGKLQELIGKGILVISLEPKAADDFEGKLERYQGIVPLESPSLAGCLENYFQQSEQLATRFWFAVDDHTASGLLLQALPQQIHTNPEENQEQWNTINTLADTLSNDELLQLDHETILYRLFNELPVRIFSPKPLIFSCSCSRERSAAALLSIGKHEVEELLIEQGHIDVDCQFCNQHYHFSAVEVRQLLGGEVLH
jgi:molecular chaperone Hsp33